MASSSSRTKSKPFQRSVSQSGRFCSSSSTFSAQLSGLSTRPVCPTRVNLYRSVSPSPTVRFSTSPSRSISVSPRHQKQNPKPFAGQKKTCMCSPTTHPGSFRCSLHKNANNNHQHNNNNINTASHSHRLTARRSAMKNSLVRIGTVEGDLGKRALAALIRPSSHHQKRRVDFQPRPSRLSNMSKAEDGLVF